jgi:hypothetical protein
VSEQDQLVEAAKLGGAVHVHLTPPDPQYTELKGALVSTHAPVK